MCTGTTQVINLHVRLEILLHAEAAGDAAAGRGAAGHPAAAPGSCLGGLSPDTLRSPTCAQAQLKSSTRIVSRLRYILHAEAAGDAVAGRGAAGHPAAATGSLRGSFPAGWSHGRGVAGRPPAALYCPAGESAAKGESLGVLTVSYTLITHPSPQPVAGCSKRLWDHVTPGLSTLR